MHINLKVLLFKIIEVNFKCTMVCRILVHHIMRFRSQAKDVEWHIPHKYSTEMAMKSHVVSKFSELYSQQTRELTKQKKKKEQR